jgi:hypothetical protein
MRENNLTVFSSMLSLLTGSDLNFFVLFYTDIDAHLHTLIRVKLLLMNLKIVTKFHYG